MHSVIGTGETVVCLDILKPESFKSFPPTARIRLRLLENKLSETLEFGTVGRPEKVHPMPATDFSAPTCQLRIVATDRLNKGRLLGSSDSWTLRADHNDGSDEGQASEGILMFQPHNIAPLCWKLDIREDSYPVVYIDRGIPDSRTWVRTDPVFTSCVLPAIVREVFEDILQKNNQPPDSSWEQDWVDWADTLMPGSRPPWHEEQPQKRDWIDNLLAQFCKHHRMLETLTRQLRPVDA